QQKRTPHRSGPPRPFFRKEATQRPPGSMHAAELPPQAPLLRPHGFRKLLHLFENTARHGSRYVMRFAEGHAPLVETAFDFEYRLPADSHLVKPRLQSQRAEERLG